MNRTNKKISIIFLIPMLFLLSSCMKNYPIVAYDSDLTKEEQNKIIKTYESELAYQESIKNSEKDEADEEVSDESNKWLDETNNADKDSLIDNNYLDYETELENNNNNISSDIKSLNSTNQNTDNNVTNTFPVVNLFKNQPDFDLTLYKAEAFENYSDLDSLGRVGKAEAMIGKETMPTNARESIGMIKPTGWHTVKYDNVEGKYLYNRCHLIGWQLSDENANEKNLFTGTRYLNIQGMLPFENQVANYIKSTGNHVLYRVTPYYSGNNLLVSHIQIEAMSYEDKGAGICFNVKLDNIQPGIHINYADGSSYQEESDT